MADGDRYPTINSVRIAKTAAASRKDDAIERYVNNVCKASDNQSKK